MAAYYYLMFAFRRLFRASPKNSFGEWQAKLLLLLVGVNVVTNVGLTVFPRVLDPVNPLIFGVVLAVPMALINESIFSNKARWTAYSKKFSALSRTTRGIADACVALIVIGSFLLPFVLRTLTTGLAWWE